MTIVPVAPTTETITASTEVTVIYAYNTPNPFVDAGSSESISDETTESATEVYSVISAAPVAYIPLNFSGEADSSETTASIEATSELATGVFTPKPYATSYPEPSGAPIFHLPKPYYTNFTLPNATYPAFNASLPVNGTNTTCSISNPTCPACNNQTLTDIHNVTYTVLCGYSLDATLDYAFGEPLTASWCMARCDERNVTCVGASWSTEECVLALGQLVGKIEDPDHMAFLRVGVLPPPYPALSTGSLPRPPLSTGLSYSNTSVLPAFSSFVTSLTAQPGPATSDTEVESSVHQTVTVSVTVPGTASVPEATSEPESDEEDVTVTVYLPSPPTTAPSWTGGRPPWAGGDYGVDEGSRHHGRPGSWWQGGRPPWSGWGWKFSSWFNHKDDEGQK